MPQSVRALIEPSLLVWARKSAGLSVEQVANKVKVSSERLREWESGSSSPTIGQLRKLGTAYKRTIAVFYLPEPPPESKPLRDFRRVEGKRPPPESPELRLEMRRAVDRRSLALDLYRELGYEPPQPPIQTTSSGDPEALGSEIRRRLGATRDRQLKFHDDYESFSWWRDAVETTGSLVFQARGVDVSEMRGFSISDVPLPVIVVNGKDSPRGRLFTMMHEYVHIMVRSGGLCDLQDEAVSSEEHTLEVFCNRVAGAMLVPKDDLLSEDVVLRETGTNQWSDEQIRGIADIYKVSREVILRRLLICGRTSSQFYKRKRQEFEAAYEDLRGAKRAGFAQPYRVAINAAGPSFTRLVLNSYHLEKITASDLSDFLNIRLKHVGKIEDYVLGKATNYRRR